MVHIELDTTIGDDLKEMSRYYEIPVGVCGALGEYVLGEGLPANTSIE